MAKPLAIDLYAGLGGWTEGLLAEGWDVIGFDIERHDYGTGGYPTQLVLMDVCQIHGAMFKDADLIVASPPCQEFSYRAMPWKRAKALPPPLLGTNLFWQCWRIQQEACEAAGRYIPLVVENVKGAQPWIGRAKGRYGSFFLWGDVENIGGHLVRSGPVAFGMASVAALRSQKFNPDGTVHGQGSWFKIADSKERGAKNLGSGSPGKIWSDRDPESSWSGTHGVDGQKLPGNNGPRRWVDREIQRLGDATKNNGGSWFAQAHNTESGHGQNPDGQQVDLIKFAAERYPELLEEQNDLRRLQCEAAMGASLLRRDEMRLPGMSGGGSDDEGRKVPIYSDPRRNGGKGARLTSPQENLNRLDDGSKLGGSWFHGYRKGQGPRNHGSKSSARKAASAQIAKIPFPLSSYIARVFKPC